MRGFPGGRRCPWTKMDGVPAPAPRVPLRNQHRGPPDRGRGRPRTARDPASGTRSPPSRAGSPTAATPSVACDHYHRYAEDVGLLKDLGARDYRFSVSWPRVLPEGHGRVNERGLDFYDRLVDSLLEAEISPTVTLFHWDLPQALQDEGGWLHRDTIDHFAAYAELRRPPARRPGRALDPHRRAQRRPADGPRDRQARPRPAAVLRRALGGPPPARRPRPRRHRPARQTGATSVGCANNHAPIWPASDSDADVGAAKLFDALWNGTYIEAMLLGRYPADLMPLMEDLVEPGDMATIRQPLDFYGVNYYSPVKIAAAPEDAPMPFEVLDLLGYPSTDAGWAVVPDGAARVADHVPRPLPCRAAADRHHRVRLLLRRRPDEHGQVDDQRRVDYLEAHVRAVARRSSAASTSAATTSGRCSTTSSGPRATSSATAWCTSTTTPRSGRPRSPSTGTPTWSPPSPSTPADGVSRGRWRAGARSRSAARARWRC